MAQASARDGTLGECCCCNSDRKSGSAGMPRPISYAVFCLKKKESDAALKIAAPGLNQENASPGDPLRARATERSTLFTPVDSARQMSAHDINYDFFFNDTATPEIYPLSLHDALPICPGREGLDFFPLTVDYREKVYAAGKFPGEIGRAGQPECRDRYPMRASACT